MTPTIVSYGELLWDLLPSGPVLGGAPANLAYRVKSLGYSVALVSRLGNDALGNAAIELLSSHEVDTSFIQRDLSHPTGTVPVTLDAAGNASYSITPEVAYDFIEPSEQLIKTASLCKALCFGTLIQRSPTSQATLYSLIEQAQHAIKVVDINLRKDCFTADTVLRSLQVSDVLKLNSDEVSEVCTLLGVAVMAPCEFSKFVIREFNLSHVLVTRGAEGVYGRSLLGEEVDLPGIPVSVVDTIGSGDAFTAGFICRTLSGCSFAEACHFGNQLGAAVAQRKGGISPCEIPD